MALDTFLLQIHPAHRAGSSQLLKRKVLRCARRVKLTPVSSSHSVKPAGAFPPGACLALGTGNAPSSSLLGEDNPFS